MTNSGLAGPAASSIITVAPLNDAPVIAGPGGTYPYTEGAGAVVLGGSASVSDSDSADFAGGQLVYQITNNGLAEDRLDIRDQGTAAGQIGVSGLDITYGGLVIGNYTGATTGDTALVVSFNSSATAAAVEATLNNFTYENTSEAPAASTRTVQAYVTDGDGGTSNTMTGYVEVTPVNDGPTATIVASGIGVNENDGYRPYPSLSVSDPDAGSSELAVTLSVNSGLIKLNVTTGVTFTVGSNDSASMTFTGTLADLNTVLASFSYRPDPDFAGTDTLTLTVDDQGNTGGGALSHSDTANIVVSPVNDAPVATADPGGYSDELSELNPLSYWRLGDAAGSAADDGSSANPGTYNGGSLGESGGISGTATTLCVSMEQATMSRSRTLPIMSSATGPYSCGSMPTILSVVICSTCSPRTPAASVPADI